MSGEKFELTEEVVNKCVLNKKYSCNVCRSDFVEPVIRTTKIKFISTDIDLHPNFEPVDPLLYGVVVCPVCGYSALEMFFNKLAARQIPLIRETVAVRFKPRRYPKVMTYRHALDKHSLALVTAVIRGAAKGEIGLICTKMAWLYRIVGDDESYMRYASRAASSLEGAYEQEQFPICQMEEATFSYLVAYFHYLIGKYEKALRWIGLVVTNRGAKDRIKEKSLELKTMIQGKLKENRL